VYLRRSVIFECNKKLKFGLIKNILISLNVNIADFKPQSFLHSYGHDADVFVRTVYTFCVLFITACLMYSEPFRDSGGRVGRFSREVGRTLTQKLTSSVLSSGDSLHADQPFIRTLWNGKINKEDNILWLQWRRDERDETFPSTSIRIAIFLVLFTYTLKMEATYFSEYLSRTYHIARYHNGDHNINFPRHGNLKSYIIQIAFNCGSCIINAKKTNPKVGTHQI
jgi:hypothetical protein